MLEVERVRHRHGVVENIPRFGLAQQVQESESEALLRPVGVVVRGVHGPDTARQIRHQPPAQTCRPGALTLRFASLACGAGRIRDMSTPSPGTSDQQAAPTTPDGSEPATFVAAPTTPDGSEPATFVDAIAAQVSSFVRDERVPSRMAAEAVLAMPEMKAVKRLIQRECFDIEDRLPDNVVQWVRS